MEGIFHRNRKRIDHHKFGMPIEFQYIDALNCLHTVGNGKVRLQEFLDYHRSINIPNPPANLLVLSDYRGLDASDLTSADIEKIRINALGRTESKYESVNEAIVASETITFGLSRMYDGVIYSEKYDVNVFTDINEARKWLGLKPDNTPGQDQESANPRSSHQPRQSGS